MSVRAERSGRVTTVILDRPAVRNAVDGPTAAALAGRVPRDFDADDGAARGRPLGGGRDVLRPRRPQGGRRAPTATGPPPDGDGPMGPTQAASWPSR